MITNTEKIIKLLEGKLEVAGKYCEGSNRECIFLNESCVSLCILFGDLLRSDYPSDNPENPILRCNKCKEKFGY